MRVFKVEFDWSYPSDDADRQAEHLKKMDRRRSALDSVGYVMDDEEFERESRCGTMKVMLSEYALLDLMAAVPGDVSKVYLVKIGNTSNTFLSALEEAMSRFEKMATGAEGDHDAMRNCRGDYRGHNHHTNTHISNNVMTSFNQVLLMEDACTDKLQVQLNEGWRVIAVCPQAARRPDYILGKFNPDIVSNPNSAPDSALRA
ncbi:hypothetical protein XccvBFoX7_gp05c [Xanthomonas phage FoX7]|uniref:Uncharacterized protein n=2 Tax=Carpasinavirus XcP1 TaxID=2182344 RepID=A0A858NQV6_9CAUD|nr:hypothetical protein XccvBFoX6_gp05c [Xanthomonas phage FoX6]QJB22162.1 hypothetical protein XccvBFoX7_gp05c [Xanthomonas phage FoX7]